MSDEATHDNTRCALVAFDVVKGILDGVLRRGFLESSFGPVVIVPSETHGTADPETTGMGWSPTSGRRAVQGPSVFGRLRRRGKQAARLQGKRRRGRRGERMVSRGR